MAKRLLGIILTGANHDGAWRSAWPLRPAGGVTVAQHPDTARSSMMYDGGDSNT